MIASCMFNVKFHQQSSLTIRIFIAGIHKPAAFAWIKRTALFFDQSEQLSFQPNFGVGFHYKGVSVDYALTDIGDQSAAIFSNVFSLIIDWKVFGRGN